jgi:NADP-dependent aldehyde dehydrogenase
VSARFTAHDPRTGQVLAPHYSDATAAEIDAACRAAAAAFPAFAALPAERRAALLDAAADALLALGDALLVRAEQETGLPRPRLEGERGRTVNQLRMFAALVREGSWVDARIDRADPTRTPPKPDLRRMLVPLGPVAVFGASNFPLAFSVAGGDTAAALAAGCPVVVKAHPAHPGTSVLAASALRDAVAAVGAPDGTFAMLHGAGPDVGQALARHAAIQAVAFTGSFRGGKALFDAAAARPQPIPVYAEMGSSNPVLLLPGALAARGAELAAAFAGSITLGTGQFCTCPGLLFVPAGAAGDAFVTALGAALAATAPGVAVHAGIAAAYASEAAARGTLRGVRQVGAATRPEGAPAAAAAAALFEVDGEAFRAQPRLAEELYGPAALVVRWRDAAELVALVVGLPGQLTGTVHADEADLGTHRTAIDALRERVGRLLFGGVPTGVEVAPAMHHGGPWPASTDARATSVGTAAILRFARPVCFQNAPAALLPEELRDQNPRAIWRLVDGGLTRDPLVEPGGGTR